MLGTGASLNRGELGVTLVEEHIATSPEISNIPLSPEVQSHLPLHSDLEQDGCDLDASVDPYAEVADEGPLEVDEPPLQEVGNGDIPLGVVQEDTEGSRFIDIPPAPLVQMKVSEIKYKLSRCGQPVGERKAVLLERLKMALFQQIPIQSTNNYPQLTTNNLNGFSPNAKWRPLVPMEEAMEEPDNATPLMHAPTIPVEDAEFIPQKHNCAERFDHECFVGKVKVPKLHHNGVPVRVNAKQQMEQRVNIKDGPEADFLLEKGLNESSKPQDWFKTFLPIFDRNARIHKKSIHNSGHTNGLFGQIKKQFLAVQVFLVVCIHHSPPLVTLRLSIFWSLHLARVESFPTDRNETLQPTNGSSSRKQPLLPHFWCKCGCMKQAVQSFLLCSRSLQNPTQ